MDADVGRLCSLNLVIFVNRLIDEFGIKHNLTPSPPRQYGNGPKGFDDQGWLNHGFDTAGMVMMVMVMMAMVMVMMAMVMVARLMRVLW